MKKFRFFAAITLALVLAFSTMACGETGDKDTDGLLGYDVNPENMFGMCALPQGYSSSVDAGVTPDMIADLTEALNVKSMRVWMHLTYVIERDAKSNDVSIKPKAAEFFHDYFAKLTAAGVENILVMNHMYIYPVEVLRPSYHGVVPEPGTEEYMIFLELQRECFRLVSEEFSEITLWEPNNETDHPTGASVVKPGYIQGSAANSAYLYSPAEVAQITADLCYYANLGIKESNPNNILVMPGLVFYEGPACATFLDLLYTAIKSGNSPTSYRFVSDITDETERIIPVDKNPDNYFNVLNWHPYAHAKPDPVWFDSNVAMYEVAKKHGDGKKKVFLTEFGWSDENTDSLTTSQTQTNIGEWYPEALDQLKSILPTLESVYCFRMFNWMGAGPEVKPREKTFGLFRSPVEPTGVEPKPGILALFKYFNGEDADTAPLYQYAKEQA